MYLVAFMETVALKLALLVISQHNVLQTYYEIDPHHNTATE